ncbi:MAG: cytochrome C oxidase subunit IV family protein [Candidatus Heimdallarchaeota archaeon]|nr:cytochrome C oxidase subunit IV family protein [Candidatus Heimdallarchaeota archaeon]
MSEQKTTETHEEHHKSPYLNALIALAVLTIVEVVYGVIMDSGTVTTIVLMTFAVAKAAVVFAIFMHVKYEKNPKEIIIGAVIIPLICAVVLIVTIHSDWRQLITH